MEFISRNERYNRTRTPEYFCGNSVIDCPDKGDDFKAKDVQKFALTYTNLSSPFKSKDLKKVKEIMIFLAQSFHCLYGYYTGWEFLNNIHSFEIDEYITKREQLIKELKNEI